MAGQPRNLEIDSRTKYDKEMKKVLFAFAALIIMAACGNKQTAAPETESSEVMNEVVTNDTISQEMKESNMQEVQAY